MTAVAAQTTVERAPPSLRDRAVRGTMWTVGAYGAESVVRLVSNYILALLFAPRVFAILMFALLIHQGISMLSDLGIVVSIVRHRDSDKREFLDTAWTIQLIRGVLIWLASAALAWPVARFYGEPVLGAVIPIAAFIAVIHGLYSTKEFTARRDLDLSLITAMRVGETLLRFAITITWALFDPSVWAIVFGTLIAAAVHIAGTHVLLRGPLNRPRWEPAAAREMLGFGRWVFVSSALTFLALQADKLLLGKLVDLDRVGVYAVAYPLAKLPHEVGAMLAAWVLFPALASRARDSKEELRRTLDVSRRVTLPAGLAATLGVVLVSPWFFALYRDAYADAMWMAPVLGAGLWFAVLQSVSDRAIPVLGTARPLAGANAAALIATLGVCTVGYIRFGLPGFVAGVGAGCLAGYLVIAGTLSRAGLPVFRRDMAYTLVLVACLGLAFGVPRLLPGQPGWLAPAATAAISAVLLAGAGLFALRRAWGAVAGGRAR